MPFLQALQDWLHDNFHLSDKKQWTPETTSKQRGKTRKAVRAGKRKTHINYAYFT
jgi:hypothetical protein